MMDTGRDKNIKLDIFYALSCANKHQEKERNKTKREWMRPSPKYLRGQNEIYNANNVNL